MKVFWCLIIYSYLFISCSSSQKISSSHTVHEEMNQKLHINRLMLYRAIGSTKVEVLANTSRIDTSYIIAVPIESMMRPMALEATNELRKFLNIKHKYADLK